MDIESIPKSRRPYNSPRRQEQARQTRLAILEAARPLFIARGYAGTSMNDIAQAAEVSIKTVEAIFGTKTRLLTALRDISVAGDDDAVPIAERVWFQEMLAEPDPQLQLRLLVENVGRIKHRTAPLSEVIRRAAQADPEIAALWQLMQQQFRADHRRLAESLAAKEALRAELDVDSATQVMVLLNHPSAYYLAVTDLGWSEEQFKSWLAEALIRQLLQEP